MTWPSQGLMQGQGFWRWRDFGDQFSLPALSFIFINFLFFLCPALLFLFSIIASSRHNFALGWPLSFSCKCTSNYSKTCFIMKRPLLRIKPISLCWNLVLIVNSNIVSPDLNSSLCKVFHCTLFHFPLSIYGISIKFMS